MFELNVYQDEKKRMVVFEVYWLGNITTLKALGSDLLGIYSVWHAFFNRYK